MTSREGLESYFCLIDMIILRIAMGQTILNGNVRKGQSGNLEEKKLDNS